MRARIALVTKMLEINSRDSVVFSLEHLLDMLRLCRSDNLWARNIIPVLYLRLHRDQDCYDFVKWYATSGQRNYDWGDMSLPFLDLENEDVFESTNFFGGEYGSTPHKIAVLLIKLRMLLDLKDQASFDAVFNCTDKLNYDTIQVIQENLNNRSSIIRSQHSELVRSGGWEKRLKLLEK